MKKTFLSRLKELTLYIVLGLVIVVGVDWYRSQDMPKDVAMDFSVQTMDGRLVNINQLSQEQPVVIYFWATWCGACKFVSPTVNWLSDHYAVVAVSGSSGSDQRVKAFLQQKGYQFDNTNDQTGGLFKQWGISLTPTIFVVKDGEVASVTTGITTPPGLLARIWLAQI